MSRVHLRKKRNKNWLVYTCVLAFVFSLIIIFKLGTFINEKVMEYATIEAQKICKYIVNFAVNSDNISSINFDNLFITTRNANGDIQSVDFDSTVVNDTLNKITETVIKYFKSVENGELDIIDLSKNLLTNTDIDLLREGIVMEIPIGIISNNSLLSNLGPKIPLRLSFTGEVESYISTSVNEYGINNALITIFVNIDVSEQVILPIASEKITVSQKIPIAIKIINGVVPNYYWGDITGNSGALITE